jgi:hypothetical protein
MGTAKILDCSTTHANLIDIIDEMFISIRSTTMEFPPCSCICFQTWKFHKVDNKIC